MNYCKHQLPDGQCGVCIIADKKDEFNSYCAEVMGYEMKVTMDGNAIYDDGDDFLMLSIHYNPYENLNQMVAVAERLIAVERNKKHAPRLLHAFFIFLRGEPIKKSFHDFIISTIKNNLDTDNANK